MIPEYLQCRIKGIFKIDDITSTNPIAVGDEVDIEMKMNWNTL
jgi:ribosome biogenesis GTPase